MDEAGELLLHPLDGLAETLQLLHIRGLYSALLLVLKAYLDLNLRLLLVDVNHLQLATISLLSSLDLFQELHLVLLDNVPGDISKLCVLSNLEEGIYCNLMINDNIFLIWRSGADRLSIDVDIRLLSQVEPDDGTVLGVGVATDFLQSCLEASQGWLTTAVHLEPGNSPEVWTARNGFRELLDFVEMIQHADRSLHVPHG